MARGSKAPDAQEWKREKERGTNRVWNKGSSFSLMKKQETD